MIIPRLLVCASVVCVLVLAACGSGPSNTPVPDLTGTPRPDTAPPTYREPAAPINRLNAEKLDYLGRLDTTSGTPSSITSAAFAPNGTRLAIIDSRSITVWDVISGRSLFTSEHHGAQAVFYSPEKTEIYTIRADGVIGVYGDDGSEKTTLLGQEAYNGRFAYNAINGWLALGGSDGSVRIWDVAGREARATLDTHTDEINGLAFSADGSHLATVGFDQKLIWWEWESRTKLWESKIGEVPPLRISIAPNDSQIALATDTQILLYNTADGSQKAALPMPQGGADDVLRYTPNSQAVIAASSRAPMTLWNSQSGQLIGQFPDATGSRVSSAFSPNGELMLMAVLDKGAELWDLTQVSAQGIPNLDLTVPSNRIVGVAWSDDGYLIALLGAMGEVYIMGVPQNTATPTTSAQ